MHFGVEWKIIVEVIQHLTDLQVQLGQQEWDGNANLYFTLERWAVVTEAGGRRKPYCKGTEES